jgi:hypothetical protein
MARAMAAATAITMAIGAAVAQTTPSAAVSYCADLKQVAALALGVGRFASIAGAMREGNFTETTLPLTGWKDCSLYGPATYTCDAQDVPSAGDAENMQARIIDEILSCFAGSWLQILDRSSSGYAVLHPAKGSASITLSVDETHGKQFVVRLTLFVRRN